MPKRPTTKSKIIDAYKEHTDYDPEQLSKLLQASGTNASPSYVDQIVRQFKEKQEQLGVDLTQPSKLEFTKVDENPEKTEQVEEIIEETKIETEEKKAPVRAKAKIKEPTQEDIKNLEQAKTAKEKGEVMDALLTGKLTKKHIISILKIENFILKKFADYEHDDETLDLIASAWEQPLNKLFAKVSDENTVLYIAIATTIIAHVPVIVKIAEKYGLLKFLEPKNKPTTTSPPQHFEIKGVP